MLVRCKADVETASNAAEAFAKLTSERFDVLISDVGMPDEDGLALMRKVRALKPSEGGRIPALALTAYARAEDRKAALRAGFNVHMAKPVEPGELALVVAALAERTHASDKPS